MVMKSQVRKAIDSKSGADLVDFLVNHKYDQEPDTSDQTPGERYMDLMDPDPGYTPNTWGEVQAHANTGVLDRPTYYAALEKRHENMSK